ncbi:hypothetical protein H6Y62_09150 [Staphylococcus lugdunensis]|uniref:hypothetical protein n=1 Tax=Staphylococcus TaxID=1279 RepID=UPI00031BFFD8|nr:MULTISPECIES: hypothetical protein [Staphylococcus]MBT2769159.1 hypothetical protein [Staphylococcus warneri]QRF15888.1 hypothetical protein H6Y62_09150 [Staphylococcus lugdunensis]RIN20351.1 hypothetical protein BU091_00275 [Staphylococcus warneri]
MNDWFKESLEVNYGKGYKDTFIKFNGYDFTGYLEEKEHTYSKFEVSLRYLMADYFNRISESVPEKILSLFEPTEHENKIYLLGNNKIYEFSIENIKTIANVAVSDFRDLESYQITYAYEDGDIQDYNTYKPLIHAIHLVFKNRSVSLVNSAHNENRFEDVVNYVIDKIQ